MGAVYGVLEHPIVHKWSIPLHWPWLAAGKWVKVFHYINQLQFSIVRRTALSYDMLYFCLPDGHFTEVCIIVILHLLHPLPLRESSGLWEGMSSFKPGWLCGSSLDNAGGVFVCVIVDDWAVFDVIPVPIVCSTGVLGLRGVGFGFGFGVEVLGAALGMGVGLLVFQVFLGIGGFSRWFYLIHQPWRGIGGWGVFWQLDLLCPIGCMCPLRRYVLLLFYKSGPENNGNKRNTQHSPNLEPHHQIWFSVIPRVQKCLTPLQVIQLAYSKSSRQGSMYGSLAGWLLSFMACQPLLGYLMLVSLFPSNYMISSN